MNTKSVAVSLALALSVGGVAQARAASADATPSAPQTVAVAAPGFYAGGVWQLHQRGGTVVTLDLTQDGSGRLYGSASYSGGDGTVRVGRVDGLGIFFIIRWRNGAEGRYEGRLGADRRLSGTTFDLRTPSSQATWFTTRSFS